MRLRHEPAPEPDDDDEDEDDDGEDDDDEGVLVAGRRRPSGRCLTDVA